MNLPPDTVPEFRLALLLRPAVAAAQTRVLVSALAGVPTGNQDGLARPS
jgi:hypothetical protein